MRLGLLVLMGLPASGKTTLAKTLKNDTKVFNGNTYDFIHVCYDDLIQPHDNSIELQWKVARNSVAAKIEKLVIAIKNDNKDLCPVEFRNQLVEIKNFDTNIVIIIDDNMYFKSMRYSIYQIAKRQNIAYCQVFLKCSLENALLKNSLRETKSVIPSPTIENMYTSLEPPNADNYWERFSESIDAYCDINDFFEKLFPLVNTALTNFSYVTFDNSEQRELSLLQCKTNIMHQTDIALRKIVGCKIKEILPQITKQELKKYSDELNVRKSEIISDIKMGNITLPSEILEEISDESVEKSNLMNFLGGFF